MNSYWILLLFNFFVLTSQIFCYIYIQVGVDSNFLVDDRTVYFAQADSSLTALNLDSGEVIARNNNIKYGGTFHLFDKGILVCNYSKISFVNKSNFEVIWQTSDSYSPIIKGDRIVSYDGNGLVRCREIRTGKILWSYNLPGALDIVVQKSKAMIFRSAVYENSEVKPSVVLLDLKSGQILMHKEAPPKIHYIQAYFDGDNIYIPTGTYMLKSTTNTTNYNYGRSSARFEKMLVYDLKGKEVGSIPASTKLKEKRLSEETVFTLNKKVFCRGQVWKSLKDIPPRWEGGGHELNYKAFKGNDKFIMGTRFDLDDGRSTITTTIEYKSTYDHVTVELNSPTYNWRGNLPYLENGGKVVTVTATDKEVILGSDQGHVEAIDRKSGQSKWIYIFPTMPHSISYSTFGMPPMLSTAAASYRKAISRTSPLSGLILDDIDSPSRPVIVFDPKPLDMYKKLPLYLTIAWAGVLSPLLLIALVIWLNRRERLGLRATATSGLLIAIGAITCFFFFGRVSIATALGFRLSILAPLVVTVVHAIKSIRKKLWISGSVILILAIALFIFMHPFFLRF